jgi:type II secretory pathway component PulM
MADAGPRSSSVTRVWIRAVLAPADRRAAPVWVGTGIVGGTVFGGTGMQPRDLTQLAMVSPVVGLVLVATWTLLFLPVARVIVRRDAAVYLRSLPSPRWPAFAIGALAMMALQLPWLLLWLVGAGAIGALVVALTTGLVVGLALVRGRPPRVGALRWRGPLSALFGVYARAVRRRGSDALIRGIGFAVFAGLTAGLFARNNQLAPREASVLATAVIAVVLTPGWSGILLPLAEAHRDSAWLAATQGISESARVAVLAAVSVAIYVASSAIAAAAAIALVPDAASWIVPVALGACIGTGLAVTRGLVRAQRSAAMAARAVIGVIVGSAIAVVALGALGASGVLAILLVGALAVGTA